MKNQNVCPLVRQKIKGFVNTDPEEIKKTISLSDPGFYQKIAEKYEGLKRGFFRFPHLFFLKNKGPVSLANLSMGMTFHLHFSSATVQSVSAFDISNKMFFLSPGQKHFHNNRAGYISLKSITTDDKEHGCIKSGPVSVYLSQPLIHHTTRTGTTHFSPISQSCPYSVMHHNFYPERSVRILSQIGAIHLSEKISPYEFGTEKVYPGIYPLVSSQKVQAIYQGFPQPSEESYVLQSENKEFHKNDFTSVLSTCSFPFLLIKTEREKSKSPPYLHSNLKESSSFLHHIMNPLFLLPLSTAVHSVPPSSFVHKFIVNKGLTRNYPLQSLREIQRSERFFQKESSETGFVHTERGRVIKESSPGSIEHFYKNILSLIQKHFPISLRTEGAHTSLMSTKILPSLSHQISDDLSGILNSHFSRMSSSLNLLHIHPLVSSMSTFSFVQKYSDGNEPPIKYYSSQWLKKAQMSARFFPQQAIKMHFLSKNIEGVKKESIQTPLHRSGEGIKSLIPIPLPSSGGPEKGQALWSRIMSGPDFMQVFHAPHYLASHITMAPQFSGNDNRETHKIYASPHSAQNREARQKIVSKLTDTQLYFYNKETLTKEIERIKEIVQETQKTILTSQSPSSYSPGKMDINHHINIHSLSDQVYQLIERKIKLENERRGIY